MDNVCSSILEILRSSHAPLKVKYLSRTMCISTKTISNHIRYHLVKEGQVTVLTSGTSHKKARYKSNYKNTPTLHS